MKKETNITIEGKLVFLTDFCERMGINYTVDRNPSPEKVEKIKASIKRKEELEKIFVERYKEKWNNKEC